jgi:hypothetical protein
MSSAEELTFVIGRWLRPITLLLNIVLPFRPPPTSSREQASTASNH